MITTYHPDGSVTYGQSPSSSSSGTGTPNSTGMSNAGNGNFTPSNSSLSGAYTPSSSGGGGNSGNSYNFNPNSANPDYKTELGRTQLAYNAYQQAYNQTKDPSMLQRMNDAASYGQQLRSKAGLPSSGGDYSSYYSSQYGSPTFNPTNGLSQGDSRLLNSYFQPQQSQATPTNLLQQQFAGLYGQMLQPYQQPDLSAQAASLANPIVSQYQNNYNSMLAKLDSQRSNDLGAVQNSTEDAKSALENQYFQNYLGARQAMADRGLAGSGLANDQDTRLLLAKQQDLAGIYRDAALQQSDINNNYTNNYNDVQNQLAQVNGNQIQNQILQQLQAQNYGQYKDQQSNLAALFKNILPYAAPQQDTVLNNQTSLANNQNTVQGELMKQLLSNQGTANVANINGQYGLGKQALSNQGSLAVSQQNGFNSANVANINGQFGLSKENITQQGANFRAQLSSSTSLAETQAKLAVEKQKLDVAKAQGVDSRTIQMANSYLDSIGKLTTAMQNTDDPATKAKLADQAQKAYENYLSTIGNANTNNNIIGSGSNPASITDNWAVGSNFTPNP